MHRPPFYYLSRGIAVEDLWHDNDACEIAQCLVAAERLPGKGNSRKHCRYCQILNHPPRTSHPVGQP